MNVLLLDQSQDGTPFLIMMLLMFGVMYFFMIRPKMKQQKEQDQFRSELQKGDKIVTIGGIYGKIVELNENSIVIESYGMKMKISRSAIASRQLKEEKSNSDKLKS